MDKNGSLHIDGLELQVSTGRGSQAKRLYTAMPEESKTQANSQGFRCGGES